MLVLLIVVGALVGVSVGYYVQSARKKNSFFGFIGIMTMMAASVLACLYGVLDSA